MAVCNWRNMVVSFFLLSSAAGFVCSAGEKGVFPLQRLPGHVSAAPGKLTLFADYKDISDATARVPESAGPGFDKTIKLYVVNRTGKKVILPAQDGDLYLKQEVLAENGLWVRAQTHLYSWCGNSYMAVEVPDESYITRPGAFHSKGKKRKVRYRVYERNRPELEKALVSNVAEALVPEAAMEAARFDAMSVNHVPQTLRYCFPEALTSRPLRVYRVNLPALGKPTPQRAAAALALLKSYGQAHIFRRHAKKLVAEAPDPTAKQAIDRMEFLLKGEWKSQRNRQALLEETVRALLTPAEKRVPATPAGERVLTWCMLQELVLKRIVGGYSKGVDVNFAYYQLFDERPVALPQDSKQALVEECRRVIAAGPAEEQAFATSMLASQAIGGGLVTAKELVRLVAHAEQGVWRWAAVGLAKRGKRDLLIEAGRKRPKGDWKHLLFMLKVQMPEKVGDAEIAFWQDLAKVDPGSLCYALEPEFEKRPTPKEIKAIVRQYLSSEIEKPSIKETGVQAFYNLKAALRFLASWKDPEDTALLKRFLKYPLTREQRWSSGEVKTIRPVQQFAQSLLKGR